MKARLFETHYSAIGTARAAVEEAAPSVAELDEERLNALFSQIGSDLLAKLGAPFALEFRQCPADPPLRRRREMRVQIQPSVIAITLFRVFLKTEDSRWKLDRMILVLALLGLAAPSREGADLDIACSLTDIAKDDCAGFSGNGENCLLMPDPPFVASGGYLGFRDRVDNCFIPFMERRSGLVWRGATSGGPTSPGSAPGARPFSWLQRLDVCHQLITGPNKENCDVGISDSGHVAEAHLLAAIDDAGLRRPRLEKIEFMKFKMALDIDGHSNAWSGLFENFLMGCCVLKVGSPRNYRQWYYPRMTAWEHYVPIASDLRV